MYEDDNYDENDKNTENNPFDLIPNKDYTAISKLHLSIMLDTEDEMVDFIMDVQKSLGVFSEDFDEKDLKIICENEEFKFSKSFLCKISQVFDKMLDHSKINMFKEAQENVLTILDVSKEIIHWFWLLIENDLEEDLIWIKKSLPEIMIFADKYDIKALVNICSYYFKKCLDETNVYEIIKTAYLVNDHDLFLSLIHI